MSFLLRTIKLKSWAGLVTLFLISVYLISIWNTTPLPKRLKQQSQFQQTALVANNNNNKERRTFDRLLPAHQQLLNSALAHIRLGYVANKTPPYSTPPLLILYSCKKSNSQCGTLDKRMLDIANHYYFSMLQPGSAFAYDMTVPVKFEWFFESSPGYMAMNSDQAKYYLGRIERPSQIKHEKTLPRLALRKRNFSEHYQSKDITIVSTGTWQGNYMDLQYNPSMKPLLDQFRLNHLDQNKSYWFWIVSRLLFSRPSASLREYLEPYRDLMGGKVDISESLSPFDPANSRVTREFAAKGWLRIGLRVTNEIYVNCLAAHVARVCQQQQGSTTSCHVFVSVPNRDLLNRVRQELNRQNGVMAVHAVAEGYGFADLNQASEHSFDHSIFDTNEDRLKRDYARTFMDWMILSRMDYLIGEYGDGFLKTTAWAAQVHTDLSNRSCQITPMTDW
jgi:hypothetical protein